jgi:hypothetical protein
MKNYLIIYHHKTGCVLSKKLIIIYQLILKEKISTIINSFNNKINFDYLNNIIKIKYTEKYLLKSKYNIYYQSSPLYSFNIFNVFKKIDKLVHFIRDPYEQSISNFIYHTQIPSPEEWFYEINCNTDTWFDNNKLYLLFDLIGLNRKMIDKTKSNIKHIYKFNQRKSYYLNLIKLKETNLEDALILETFRFIFSSSHMLKMALILKKNYKFKYRILNLSFNDFKDDKIENTVQKISSYFFQEKINNKIIVNKLKKSYDNTKKKGIHVNNKSNEYKNKLKNILKNNIIINKIFTKIQDIIAEYA